MIFLWIALILAALCIGHVIGTRMEASYWRLHEKIGGCIRSNGRFYVVIDEKRHMDLCIAANRLEMIEGSEEDEPAIQPKLPIVLPGHWETPDGHDMAMRYADGTRDSLALCNKTDLELANMVFMASRHDLNLIVVQTAAKDRIRWLSVQLAMALARAAKTREVSN